MLEHSWRTKIVGVRWCSPGNRPMRMLVPSASMGPGVNAPLAARIEYATGANTDKGLSVAIFPTIGPGIEVIHQHRSYIASVPVCVNVGDAPVGRCEHIDSYRSASRLSIALRDPATDGRGLRLRRRSGSIDNSVRNCLSFGS
ncbi:hypothetical protein [Nocardia sp. NPDC052112]|uniref:hypothetical protein n=1 Tax=Nocardia sp. NPDC052112 TaxID=3155646 RepID=UPI00341AE9A0